MALNPDVGRTGCGEQYAASRWRKGVQFAAATFSEDRKWGMLRDKSAGINRG